MTKTDNNLSLLKNLNSVQRQSVEKINGPNLILAGAGSGKTRVLTHKIAYLIQRKKIKPENILAMTFTNKAANEMKSRVEALLDENIKGLWIGTFHSIFVRILRKNCEKIGYHPNFVIYDESDQLALIKTIIADMNLISLQQVDPKTIQSKIKYLKNSNTPPDELKLYGTSLTDDLFQQIYFMYLARLQQNNAMDFEDLLLKSIELFRLFPSVLEFYQNLFLYILVDEYQDTNRVQYQLIKVLGQKHRNISVVGDDDQSIYRWRGADVRNILEFERDYPDCSIFRLEQNYRSTGNILSVAHSIIAQNKNRMEKELWTKKEAGEKATFILAGDAKEEALGIIHKIDEELQNYQRTFSSFAILYRTNAQSRAIEEVLKNNAINYTVVGGIRFYERKEIKDILAYLKVLTNPNDSINLKRIINYPTRGIGETTLKKIEKFCSQNKLTLFQALSRIEEIDSVSTKSKDSITAFHNLINKYIALQGSFVVGELITSLIDELGIITILKQDGSVESLSKIENIRELLNGINEFIAENPHLNLENYLENVSLITDIDNWDPLANAVSLLTLHSAKGLEFPVVFITGLEDGLFPLARQMATDEGIEEERRLFYVGATRAREKLYLSAALNRQRFGEQSNGTISRFLNEIKKELLDIEDNTRLESSHYDRTNYKPRKVIRFKTEEPKSEELKSLNADRKEMKSGILVKHPTFGRGVVRSTQGKGEDQIATILFEDVGAKKIVLKFSKLEILS